MNDLCSVQRLKYLELSFRFVEENWGLNFDGVVRNTSVRQVHGTRLLCHVLGIETACFRAIPANNQCLSSLGGRDFGTDKNPFHMLREGNELY